jgi:hypothetical protein
LKRSIAYVAAVAPLRETSPIIRAKPAFIRKFEAFPKAR